MVGDADGRCCEGEGLHLWKVVGGVLQGGFGVGLLIAQAGGRAVGGVVARNGRRGGAGVGYVATWKKVE